MDQNGNSTWTECLVYTTAIIAVGTVVSILFGFLAGSP